MPIIGATTTNISKETLTDQGSDPAAAPAGKHYLYTKSDGLYVMDSSGTATGPFGLGDFTNPMSAQGDLIYGGTAGAATPLAIGTDGYGLISNGTIPTWEARYGAIEAVLTDGGSIATGIKCDIEVPYACTIDRVTMLADQTGTVTVDIWKSTYANYPPTDGVSITGTVVPSIAGTVKYQDSTLTSWTTALSAGDILRFNVDAATTVTRCTVSLRVKKT